MKKFLLIFLMLIPSLAFGQVAPVNIIMPPGGAGGGVTDHGALSGVTPTNHHVPTVVPNIPAYFDCVVDDGGDGDYTTINSAWTDGCRSMFIQNGTYTLTADLVETDTSTIVQFVGQSMSGVNLDSDGYYLAKIYDSAKPVETWAGTVAIDNGSKILTGTTTTFQTWDLNVGDWACPGGSSYDHLCYTIASIDSETQITLSNEFDEDDLTGRIVDGRMFFGPAYEQFRLENFTLTNSGTGGQNKLTSTYNVSKETDGSLMFAALIKNIDTRPSGGTRLFREGCAVYSRLENVFSDNAEIYMGGGSLITDSYLLNESFFDYDYVTYRGNTISGYIGGIQSNIVLNGNRFSNTSGGLDFTDIGIDGTAIGNTIEPSSTDAIVEELRGSLNLPGFLGVGSYIDFNITPTIASHSEGRLHWDDTDKTLEIDTEVTGTHIQVGQEIVLRGTNSSGVQIDNGEVVYIDGASGSRPTINLADADTESLSYVIGIVTHDIANTNTGYVTTYGLVRDIDTSLGATCVAGDAAWLSQTAGAFTCTKPSSPAHSVYIGRIVFANATSGILFVTPINGNEIEELHNVDDAITSGAANGDVPYWNSSNSLWEGKAESYAELWHDNSGTDSNTTTLTTPTTYTQYTDSTYCAVGNETGSATADATGGATCSITVGSSGYGTYLVNISISATGSASGTAHFALFQEGAVIRRLETERTVSTATIGVINITGLIDVTGTTDDLLDLRAKVDTGNITFHHVNINVQRIGM